MFDEPLVHVFAGLVVPVEEVVQPFTVQFVTLGGVGTVVEVKVEPLKVQSLALEPL